jgi:hypothetical protein
VADRAPGQTDNRLVLRSVHWLSTGLLLRGFEGCWTGGVEGGERGGRQPGVELAGRALVLGCM